MQRMEKRKDKIHFYAASLRLTVMERAVLDWLIENGESAALYGYATHGPSVPPPYSESQTMATLRRLGRKGCIDLRERKEVVIRYDYALFPELADDSAKAFNAEVWHE